MRRLPVHRITGVAQSFHRLMPMVLFLSNQQPIGDDIQPQQKAFLSRVQSQVTMVKVLSRSFIGGVTSGATWGTTTRSTDLSDSRYARVTETYSYQLATAGSYNFEWSSCCHVSGIANASGGEDLTSTIVWDGANANTPILFDFSSVNPEVVRGAAYNDNLGAVSGSGNTLTYDQNLTTGIINQIPGFSVDANTGALHIAAADTANMTNDNTGNNIGADYAFSGNINSDDGSKVEFEWVFDAVDRGTSTNLAPTVNDMVINVFQGDVINATVTGADPDGDTLTWNLQSLFGPGDTSGFGFDPSTQIISWNTTGVNIGTYIANIRASDGSLTDVGTITMNIAARTSQVPEPAMLGLFGLGLVGMGLVRHRRTK